MSIPEKQNPWSIKKELTSELAQEIYNKMVENNIKDDPTRLFTEYWYKIYSSEGVYDEVKRLEKEAVAYVLANPDCNAQDVIDNVSSAILDVPTVWQHIIKYNPIYKSDRTFEEWKDSILNVEEI